MSDYQGVEKKRNERRKMRQPSPQGEQDEPVADTDTEFFDLVKGDTEHKIEVEDLRVLFEAKMETYSSTWIFLLGLAVILIQAGSLSANPGIIDLSRFLLAVVAGAWIFYTVAFSKNPRLKRNKVFVDYLNAKELIKERTQQK